MTRVPGVAAPRGARRAAALRRAAPGLGDPARRVTLPCRRYALDEVKAKRLWANGEELVSGA